MLVGSKRNIRELNEYNVRGISRVTKYREAVDMFKHYKWRRQNKRRIRKKHTPPIIYKVISIAKWEMLVKRPMSKSL
jgi:hypothetical protein